MEGTVTINGLDFISIITLVDRRTRRYSAIMLNDIEQTIKSANLPKEVEDRTLKFVRKAVLDNVNELKRAWLRDVFSGDVEDINYGA
jgi:hypothetical protein